MQTVTLYHNPRCSKSRQALQLLQDQGCDTTIIDYLTQPLSAQELQLLLQQLQCPAQALLRCNEPEYTIAGLHSDSDQSEILAAIAQYPKLMQRPIVVCEQKAVIARPPAQLMEIL